MQERLVEEYRQKQDKNVKNIQRQIVTSFAARALAVRRVASNSGSKTPGVDGLTWPNPAMRLAAIEEMRHWTQNPSQYKAKPVKRIMIPKPGKTELRPLGIPTLLDRAMQALYLSSLDPIVEEQSDANSYGFRPYRASRDALAKLRDILGKDYSPNWILDADIEKCFDKINHNWLLTNVPIVDKCVLTSWLQSGITTMDGSTMPTMEQGVPQGGVISPVLCNIALNGLETAAQQSTQNMVTKRQRTKVHVIRYADDFITTAGSEHILDEARYAISTFLEQRGLKLHDEKTRKIRMDTGQAFDFLGFSLMKRRLNNRLNMQSRKNNTNYRLIIRPSRSNIANLKRNVKQLLVPGKPIAGVIKDLNPILRGWSNYFTIARHSPKVFRTLGNWLWLSMVRWAQKKHQKRNIQWIKSTYTKASKWRTNHWCYKTNDATS